MTGKYIVEGEHSDQPHVWANNAAWNLVKKVREAERGGLTYLCMSALVFIAFANEANLNFVGGQVLGDGWPDSAKTTEKLELLTHHFAIVEKNFVDASATAKGLIKIRNRLAHPKRMTTKSFKKQFDQQPSDAQVDELLRTNSLNDYTVSEVDKQYAAMKLIYETLLAAADIEPNYYRPSSKLSVKRVAAKRD